jgi:hypothetical protein
MRLFKSVVAQFILLIVCENVYYATGPDKSGDLYKCPKFNGKSKLDNLFKIEERW